MTFVEALIGSFLIFGMVAIALTIAQRLRRAPMPVGCTPVNGECCRNAGFEGACERLSAAREVS